MESISNKEGRSRAVWREHGREVAGKKVGGDRGGGSDGGDGLSGPLAI